jgi:hypothetical protein
MLSDTLKGVLLGGGISMAGLLLNSLVSLLQKERERKTALRRDIYLPAIEALAAMRQYLATLARPALPSENDSSPINAHQTAALEKVHAVGSLSTLAMLEEASGVFNAEMWNLYWHRSIGGLICELAKGSLLSLDGHLSDARIRVAKQREANELTEEQLQVAIGVLEQARTSLQAELQKLILNATLELARLGRQAILRFHEVQVRANLCLRNELGFPIDDPKYLELMEKSRQEGVTLIDAVISKAENNLQEGVIQKIFAKLKEALGDSPANAGAKDGKNQT